MKHYELYYLISGQVPENQLEEIQSEISKWIAELGGVSPKTQPPERKKLAYPIAKEGYGFYVAIEFEAETSITDGLQKKLKLHKGLLRYILTTKKPISEKELLKQEKARKSMQEKRLAKASPDKRIQEPYVKTPAPSTTPDKKKEPKIQLDELDKKLDELLDQDITT